MPMIAPPTMMALLKMPPAVFLDDTPKKIKNAAKTNPINESAFILFNCVNSG